MKIARWVVLLGFAVLDVSAVSAKNACLTANRDGQQAEGRLDQVKITTEAYNRTETVFILSLSKPACLEGADEYNREESTKRIQVYSMDKEVLRKMRANIGKNVRVTGSPFGEDSPYHHAPIVMDVSEVVRR